MKKIDWNKVWVFILRLTTRFIVVTAFAAVLLYGFFRDSKALDYILSEEAPGGIFWFIGVTYGAGFMVCLIVLAASLFSALTEKDEEIETLKQKNARLRKKINRLTKSDASSLADRMFGEIASNDDVQTPNDSSLEEDFKQLQEMLKKKPSDEKE